MMSESAKLSAHSCAVHPELKDDQPSSGKYGRMLPRLPPCKVEVEATVGLGRAASRMDSTLPVVDAALENPRIPAGFAIFGQFVAHDITADRSLLAHYAVAGELQNFRSPRLDLDCLYGDGPVGNPFLYDANDADKLLLGTNAAGEPDDLPRNHQGVALLGDSRNDVHLLISQLHLAFLRLHNRVVDWLRERGTADDNVFEEARRLVRCTISGSWPTSSCRSPSGKRSSPTSWRMIGSSTSPARNRRSRSSSRTRRTDLDTARSRRSTA
jgi:hypothetical protein